MLKVYGDIISGNCYKIKLLLSLLDQPHEWVHVDIVKGEARLPGFLAKAPNGKVPLLEMEPGKYLSESNAILNFLAEGTPYLPENKYLRAQVLQWQFFEQYSHEPYIAVARFIAKYQGMPDERKAEYDRHPGGYKALKVMEQHLATAPFFVGNTYTIADISLYGYTHVAHEGGFDLSGYPRINDWLARVRSHPRHATMEQFTH